MDRKLIHAGNSNLTERFLQENPNIISIRADKGNIKVALDKEFYLYKMIITFSDESESIKSSNSD